MSGRLLRAQGLSEGERGEIADLAETCNQAEGLMMRLNWPALRRRAPDQVNDFLWYEGNRLTGYLGLYQFTFHEAEATAMVHPDRRRRGIFHHLMSAARGELEERGAESILFFHERRSPSAAAVAQATRARFDHTEYLMEVEPEAVRPAQAVPGLALRLATEEDLPMLAPLDEDAFGVPAASNHYLAFAVRDTSQRFWVVTLHGQPVGKIQGRFADGANHIFGFVIERGYRGRGYGSAALSEAMQRLLYEQHAKVTLEVLTNNDQALKVYRNRGFEVVTAYDYHRLPVDHA